MTIKITFEDLNTGKMTVIEAQPGERLNQAAYNAGVQIQQSCGGSPSCTDCKIIVKNGHEDNFEAPEGAELRLLGNVYFITKERLACQAIIKQDSHIIVPQYKSNSALKNKKFLEGRIKQQNARQEKKQKNSREATKKSGQKNHQDRKNRRSKKSSHKKD